MIPRVLGYYSREHHDRKRARWVVLLCQHSQRRSEDDEWNEEDADNEVVLSILEVQVVGEACCLRIAEVALVKSVEEVYATRVRSCLCG